MSKTVIKTDRAPKAVARYSQGIKVGNTLYVQGVIALDPQTGKLVTGTIEPQAERVFESLKAIGRNGRHGPWPMPLRSQFFWPTWRIIPSLTRFTDGISAPSRHRSGPRCRPSCP